MRDLLTSLKNGAFLAASGLLLSLGLDCLPAQAVPQPNAQGDFTATGRGSGHSIWQVADPDPNGLNCRMAKRFQGVSLDGADAPLTLYQANIHPIGEWEVVATFQPAMPILAVTGNLDNQIIVRDRQGKPWLGVTAWRGKRIINCFVRANRQYIRPFREN